MGQDVLSPLIEESSNILIKMLPLTREVGFLNDICNKFESHV